MKIPIQVSVAIFIGYYAVFFISFYWILWFVKPEWVQLLPFDHRDYLQYVRFEENFILADGWIILSALIGISGLKRLKAYGYLFLNLAASSAVFLGLMDLSYLLQNPHYFDGIGDLAVEIFNICSCLLLAPTAIYLLYQNRKIFS